MMKTLITLLMLIAVLFSLPQMAFAASEPSVTITLDKKSIAVGELVTAEYEIIGSGNYRNIMWDCTIWSTENEAQGTNDGWGKLEKLKGTFAYAPKFGVAMRFSVSFEDETGRSYYGLSSKIPINGYVSGYDIYSVIEGQDALIFNGDTSLTFRIDGDFEKYLGVQVNGKAVPSQYVKAWSGSTYVELSAEYLDSLSEGEHELTIVFDDGIAVTKFVTTKKLPELPQTGDNSLPMVFLILTMVTSICSLGILMKKRIN